ncbi:hypothetical protein TCAL_06717 [Tigriopus californicus]|uniref:non-specific serine/threonine protein kinase n=1 Tax=Tigriopus californicus TaxID=6832 RepID=A0A553P4Z6_TIGCA|nr:EKC/KEOPS complex subunit Tp53rkb-like [Tigriopus californicus]TRY72748.1 hypothetical protein TCAL_06717 [Tigriopus californicus]|eukprot:TCALIF_06717-PA protein Name:"Similar to Tp53rk TP53-regulating kinase (Mus musculus)" AED:0.15 eAED:0.15 QI:0/-1/0/1/-1/1/1/0/231
MAQSDLTDLQLYKQGAEGRLFTGEYLGQKVLVKQRFPKKYRHPQLDAQLSAQRFRGEVRSLIRCQSLGIRTPTILLADLDQNIIVMEFLARAQTCRYFIQTLLAEDGSEPRLLALAQVIGKVLALIHSNHIIHGDLTTSNILVANPGAPDCELELVLIDFGLGFAEGSAEDKGVDLYVLERAFLSTHPNTEAIFDAIMKAYKSDVPQKDCSEILKKYEEIRLRGRKRTMLG